MNFKAIINQLLTEHKITVVKWSKSSCGRACVDKRLIKIPKPTNIDRFCVCLHEIGHIVKQATKRKMKLYQSEFLAESYVFEIAEKLQIDVSSYKERARRYVIMNIAKGYCRGLNLNTINPEVKKFCDIDFSAWEGKKVFVKNWGSKSYTKPLEIEFGILNAIIANAVPT